MLNISYQNIKLCLIQYEKTNALVDIIKTITVDKNFNFDFTNYIGFTRAIRVFNVSCKYPYTEKVRK